MIIDSPFVFQLTLLSCVCLTGESCPIKSMPQGTQQISALPQGTQQISTKLLCYRKGDGIFMTKLDWVFTFMQAWASKLRHFVV